MKFKLIFFCIVMFSTIFAEEKIYELDGSFVKPFNSAFAPRVTLTKNHLIENNNIDDIYDSIFFQTKNLNDYIEMKKNKSYKLCADINETIKWEITHFKYRQLNNNCILLFSGNFVKSEKIQYITQMGNVHSLNIFVGMKYIDLSKQKHLLGFYGPEFKYKKKAFYLDPISERKNRTYPDSIRTETLNTTLAVDVYKVTECEVIQTLWDSIPNFKNSDYHDFQKYWILKKEKTIKNAYCDANDSAAIMLKPYLALLYANARSLRDDLTPVYSFETTDDWKNVKIFSSNKFGIEINNFKNEKKYVIVTVQENANGYRLPYYEEWMALARGGLLHHDGIWEIDNSTLPSQYAWFATIEPDDHYAQMSKENPLEASWLKHSCGKRKQKSRPVGLLKPNTYALYDIQGLVCENVMLKKSIFDNEVLSCKGGFLSSALEEIFFGSHCDYSITNSFTYQGLRLVRKLN